MASLVRWGILHLRPVQWWAATAWCQSTGNWSDKITVPQWVLSEVACWASPAVLQGLPFATRETEVTRTRTNLFHLKNMEQCNDSLHGCVQFGLGSQVRLTLDSGTVVSISKIVAHQRSEDAGWHQHCERLPSSSEVPSGVLDLRQHSDCSLHQERGRHTILHTHADDVAPAEVVRKEITLIPVHLPGVHNIQADSLSRVSQTLNTEWTMTMERLRPVFAEWGEPQVDLFATFGNRRLIKFSSPYPDLRAEFTDAMSVPWDHGKGLLYAFPPFKMVPQVLQKIAQSPGVRLILIAPLQETASRFPELLGLSQEDPIQLYVEGQPLLTQDVMLTDGVTETHNYRPSNLHAWKLYGPS